jgi:eukaryotic-like serine/threonine-protein kinase
MGMPGVTSFSPNLYPAYVWGEAYLAANRGLDALAEFRKITSHRGLALNESIAALAHLGIARAENKTANVGEARVAYKVFLDIWKNADDRIPILLIAKQEYSKLN